MFLSMSELLSIGEVSKRSGVASSALRFYQERGLITSERAGSGRRHYPRSVLRRIAFIVFAQRIGLSLEEIGAELASCRNRAPTRRDWSRLSAAGRRDRRADRRARAAAARAYRMHRLRLPVARPLQAGQPGRPDRESRPRPALLARRSARQLTPRRDSGGWSPASTQSFQTTTHRRLGEPCDEGRT